MKMSDKPITPHERRWWQDKSTTYVIGWAMWFVFTVAIVTATVVVTVAITVGQAVSNHVDRIDCAKYSKATGLETRFAYYGFWHNECILIGPNGVELPDNRTINNVGN